MMPLVRISPTFPTLCLAASMFACGPAQPTAEPAEPATAAPTSDTSEITPPEVEPAPSEAEPEPAPEEPPTGCQVQLMLETNSANGKLASVTTLRASAKNLTEAPLELTLPDRCPGGEAMFSGLEPVDGSYDYYSTCAMGMCAPGRPARVIALPPGEVVEISSVEIHPKGKKPCNEPLAAGKYTLSFTVESDRASNPVLCGPEPLELTR
jgi:hypothetical protein